MKQSEKGQGEVPSG